MTVLDTIYGVAQAWSSVNPDLEHDDLRGFPNEEISKSEILDMVYAMKH
jgi:hypothetical protein